jgi:hypothetical protein
MNEPSIRRNTKNTRDGSKPTATGRRTAPRGPRQTVEWDSVPNQLLRDAICAVTGRGAAIMLSRTSDGGALSITVLDGGERIKEYPRDADECEATLRWLVDMFSSD